MDNQINYYNALLRRDRSYDGKIFVCVKTTKIFCLLSCAARKPLENNVEFVNSIAEAKAKNYRACLRCRPENIATVSYTHLDVYKRQNKTYEGGNMGHRPGPKGGYFPLPPIDSCQDLRGEMLAVMKELNLDPEKHHHEVSPAQHELGLKFQTLVKMADNTNLYKYVVQNVAAAFGKTATFMPKPFFKENGNGMHVHQSIWKDGKPLFAGDKYADLSQECLYYICLLYTSRCV